MISDMHWLKRMWIIHLITYFFMQMVGQGSHIGGVVPFPFRINRARKHGGQMAFWGSKSETCSRLWSTFLVVFFEQAKYMDDCLGNSSLIVFVIAMAFTVSRICSLHHNKSHVRRLLLNRVSLEMFCSVICCVTAWSSQASSCGDTPHYYFLANSSIHLD